MKNSFYNNDELKLLGLGSFGQQVLISKKCSLYSPNSIFIGNNIRIDDFCILSGKIQLGSNIHISAYSALYGSSGIEMEDYTGLSPRTTIFSAIDDFSGNFLIGPMSDLKYRNILTGRVLIKKYSQIGSGTIIFPGITINEGVAVGALSLVNDSLDEWKIYAGVPAKFLKLRSKEMLCFLNKGK